MSTKIDYVDEVWNPVIGCSKCSPGCKNCYAEKMATRQVSMGFKRHLKDPDGDESAWIAYSGTIDPNTGKWNGDVELRYDQLDKPLHWRQPRKILTCSMGDLFHEKVPFEFIDEVFNITEKTEHTYLILTKRLTIMKDYFLQHRNTYLAEKYGLGWNDCQDFNIHLGVSISTQAEADEKIPILLQIPAAVRWLSIEPMLEEINLKLIEGHDVRKNSVMTGKPCIANLDTGAILKWVVIGAESINGRAGRRCELDWVQSVVNQCKTAGVPVWVKQLHINGKLIRDIDKFPEDLRLREPVARQKGR